MEARVMHTARLKAITMPVEDGIPGPAELLAYFARVSSTANQMNHDSGPKLLRSLIKRKEWSPLDMVNLVMEVESTRDIVRQLLRHHSMRFQEFSQRYAEVTGGPVFREARLQHPTDRQASVEVDDPDLQAEWEAKQKQAWEAAQDAYRWALKRGIAKECARAPLNEGMTPSLSYANGTLRSWFHYVCLRADLATQKEHRLIAEDVKGVIIKQFPMFEEMF